MIRHSVRAIQLTLAAAVVLSAALSGRPAQAADACGGANCVYLPAVSRGCTAVGGAYAQGLAIQYDIDNPPRRASEHADKNYALRGYTATTGPTQSLISYGASGIDHYNTPPQFQTLFGPGRLPTTFNLYRMNSWDWGSNTVGAPLDEPNSYAVTALGMNATPGEAVLTPDSSIRINGPFTAMVIFADADSVMLRYSREDSNAPPGYGVYIDQICTDPNLLSLYNSLDSGNRLTYHGQFSETYNLPYVMPGQAVGTAKGTEVVVAVSDTGAIGDPRACEGHWTPYANNQTICPLRNGSTIQ